MKIYCKKKCFQFGRLWEVGEAREVEQGEKIPAHFSKTPVGVADTKEKEIEKRKEAVAAVGHNLRSSRGV
ncbi:MAG: hypothetical protein K9M56_04270 [Victivallales bacterium]|nr:hypothetical protein [Victivallales bacterium]